MDRNNVHTSVLLKLSGERETEGEKVDKIDLEDVEGSKEYVIDQLFCDDDVAVYAVFEASNTLNGKSSQRNLRKVSCSNLNEFRFSQRQSCINRKDDKTLPKKTEFVDSVEEPAARLEPRTDNFNYSGCGGACGRGKNSSGAEERLKCLKFKSVSKGVNTDIDQSPKLLEEVQKAVSLNFSKINEKNSDLLSVFSMKSSQDVMEVKTRVSSTTLSLDRESGKNGKKSHPNIVIVPVVIKDEEFYNFWRDDKSQKSQSLYESSGSKATVLLEKVSVSTSTELSLLEPKSNKESESLHCKVYSNGKLDEKEKRKKSQEFLIEEIKNLQEKFNALLKSLEFTGFPFGEKKETKDKTMESNECYNEETAKKETEKEIPLLALKPENLTYESLTPDNCAEEKERLLSELIDWNEMQNYKGPFLSKSQTDNRGVLKNINLKRSLSLDLNKEIVGLKKLENIFFKLEGSFKKEKSKTNFISENLSLLNESHKAKLNELSKYKSVEAKSKVNNCTNSATAYGLLKIQREQLNKGLEKGTTEKFISNRLNTRTCNDDSGDMRNTNATKKAGLRSRIIEAGKEETKTPFFPEEKPKSKSVIPRVSVTDSPQSKLHVNLLIKSHENSEQKVNNLVKCNSTRLPRASFQKKDYCQKLAKKEGPNPSTQVSVKKNLEQDEVRNEMRESEKLNSTTTSTVVVELFSKKPTSIEDFYSEVDLQSLHGNDIGTKKNSVCMKNDNSKDCQNAVVKSVWALTKVLLYEDGTKKMEVLEASLNPPDYCFNQKLGEDKIR